ncbi:hypothetical protein KJ766_03510 [Patescibacteria group bacterium]|nr:hypothetical protein [Patescibacteria group bacterium]
MEWAIEKKKTKLVKHFKQRHPGAISSPFYLNSAELATLFHFPSADARTPILAKLSARRSEAPADLEFALEGTPDLQNLDRAKDGEIGAKKTLPSDPGPLVVPKVGKSFEPFDTAFEKQIAPVVLDEQIPVPGMPAPLPPGLDLSPEPLGDGQSTPRNLPM